MKLIKQIILFLGVVSCSIFATFNILMTILTLSNSGNMVGPVIYGITIPAFIFWTACCFNVWRLVK